MTNLELLTEVAHKHTNKTGQELENIVHGVSAMLAEIAGNKEASQHFLKRFKETCK